jgi:origin recognition complex subunit 3
VQATDAPNLKTLLKNINQKGTRQQHDDEDDDMDVTLPASSKTKGPKLLNYDLDILRQHCERLGGQKVVLAVQDSEAFDAGVLTDLFTLLQCVYLVPCSTKII